MMRKLRKLSIKLLSEWYQRRHNIQWNEESLPHVAIECWSGFMADNWLQTLDSEFSEWRHLVEIQFIQNTFERYALEPGMDMYVSTWLTSDLLSSSPRLKWVQLMVAGAEFLEGIDIPSQLQITTVAGVASAGVAEHVIGLMIALDRRFDIACVRQRKWVWQQDGLLENIRGLRGHTVGIIGLGNIGQAVAVLAKGMGMRVIGMSRRRHGTCEWLDVWYGPEELLELLSQADFVVLCVPLNSETEGMMGRKELASLGKDSYLINVARGKLIDEYTLAWALKKGIIAGAALDVLSSEPPPRRHPLRRCPNLIITPHIAGNIYTFREEIRRRFAHNLRAFLNGGELEGLYMPYNKV